MNPANTPTKPSICDPYHVPKPKPLPKVIVVKQHTRADGSVREPHIRRTKAK